MTTTTEASEALARLREVVKPGGTVYYTSRRARSGDTRRVTLWAIDGRGPNLAVISLAVAEALGLHVAEGTKHVVISGDRAVSDLLDRLSVALFGEPGLIRGEYL